MIIIFIFIWWWWWWWWWWWSPVIVKPRPGPDQGLPPVHHDGDHQAALYQGHLHPGDNGDDGDGDGDGYLSPSSAAYSSSITSRRPLGSRVLHLTRISSTSMSACRSYSTWIKHYHYHYHTIIILLSYYYRTQPGTNKLRLGLRIVYLKKIKMLPKS